MAILSGDGKSYEYHEPKPGIYIPVFCNAVYFGGSVDAVVKVSIEQVKELTDKIVSK